MPQLTPGLRPVRLGGADLIDAPLMPAAFKRRLDPQRHDFIGEAEGDDAPAHRQDVGVVVLARQPGSVEIVAQSRAHARHLVRGDLLALTASADDDAAIVDIVAEPPQRVFHVFLEEKTGVIGPAGDAHKAAIVL